MDIDTSYIHTHSLIQLQLTKNKSTPEFFFIIIIIGPHVILYYILLYIITLLLHRDWKPPPTLMSIRWVGWGLSLARDTPGKSLMQIRVIWIIIQTLDLDLDF